MFNIELNLVELVGGSGLDNVPHGIQCWDFATRNIVHETAPGEIWRILDYKAGEH